MSKSDSGRRNFSTARRSAARLAAVQAVYQMDMGKRRASRVVADFEEHGFPSEPEAPPPPPSDVDWFTGIVKGVETGKAGLDTRINEALGQDRDIEHREAVIRAILRAATFELCERLDVPARVVITEYVDVAHAFYTGTEPALVNGVLNAVARNVRPAEFEAKPA